MTNRLQYEYLLKLLLVLSISETDSLFNKVSPVAVFSDRLNLPPIEFFR